ncbi:protein of unknown function [Rhodovastum atsumiense]|nr:protein of unknown function [Rhodovastum atsumiense]
MAGDELGGHRLGGDHAGSEAVHVGEQRTLLDTGRGIGGKAVDQDELDHVTGLPAKVAVRFLWCDFAQCDGNPSIAEINQSFISVYYFLL